MAILDPQIFLDAFKHGNLLGSDTTFTFDDGKGNVVTVRQDLELKGGGRIDELVSELFGVVKRITENKDIPILPNLMKISLELGMKPALAMAWIIQSIMAPIARKLDDLGEDVSVFGIEIGNIEFLQKFGDFLSENLTLDFEGVFLQGFTISLVILIALIFVGLKTSPKTFGIFNNVIGIGIKIITRFIAIIGSVV